MTVPTRPVLRYHGGKWRLAPWIIGHFPAHRTYVEPYSGGGSVLMRKDRAYAEVYNDLWGTVVNVFRVLRDPGQAAELERLLRLTPFARDEFDLPHGPTLPAVELARRTMLRSFAGFASAATNEAHNTGFRGSVTRSGTTPAHDWANFPGQIAAFTERLQGVVIENRAALDVIEHYDGRETLHYVDPPYARSVRSPKSGLEVYAHEMTDDDHRTLAATLHQVEGMVVLSGYACDLYDRELYPDWQRIERKTHADGARDRIEVLWLNAACAQAQLTLGLFATVTP